MAQRTRVAHIYIIEGMCLSLANRDCLVNVFIWDRYGPHGNLRSHMGLDMDVWKDCDAVQAFKTRTLLCG